MSPKFALFVRQISALTAISPSLPSSHNGGGFGGIRHTAGFLCI
jgi:hypothetical protein